VVLSAWLVFFGLGVKVGKRLCRGTTAREAAIPFRLDHTRKGTAVGVCRNDYTPCLFGILVIVNKKVRAAFLLFGMRA
jgi:hypothetical protein